MTGFKDNTHAVVLLLTLLSTTTQPKDEVEGRLLLNVVVRERAAILELLAGEDQSLLVRRDADESQLSASSVTSHTEVMNAPFLVLDLRFDVVDRVRGLDLKGDSLTREGLYENLHLAARGPVSITARTIKGFARRTQRCRRYGRPCLSNELNGGVFDEGQEPVLQVVQRKGCLLSHGG
jgi:hypothetical protein